MFRECVKRGHVDVVKTLLRSRQLPWDKKIPCHELFADICHKNDVRKFAHVPNLGRVYRAIWTDPKFGYWVKEYFKEIKNWAARSGIPKLAKEASRLRRPLDLEAVAEAIAKNNQSMVVTLLELYSVPGGGERRYLEKIAEEDRTGQMNRILIRLWD